uniref:hypothetical protein n=1 Tax=Dyella ginsengisoli TaxID=363848 RepID=UPI0012FDE280
PPPLPKRFESSKSESENESKELPDATMFGPDSFVDVFAASEAVDYKRRGEFFASWLNHCREQGAATQALHCVWSYFESSEQTYGADEVLDEAFRLSLEVEGKDAAYPWLVKAHIHRSGWQSWFTSENEAMGRLELAATHFADRWLSYIRDTSVPVPYYRRRGHGLVIGYKYLVRFLVLAGQVEVASAVTDTFVETLADEVQDQPIPPSAWFKPNSPGISNGLAMLFTRLKWPVPRARFLVARKIRELLENVVTRPAATAALLEHLQRCRYESETCEILNLLMLASDDARPPHDVVACRIKHPSILADLLLEKTFGNGKAIGGWRRTYSPEFPRDFEPASYFEEHKTAHVPPVYRNHFVELERQSGFPFETQWAFEWKNICESLGTRYTRYPYYFGDFSEFREGIVGQFWQRMREAYLSAYLRTLAFAVSELGLPQKFAENWCLEMVNGIHGLNELTPVRRPDWLGDFPERALASGDELETVAREFIAAMHRDGMRLASLRTPLESSVDNYAILDISSHLVTSDYEPDADPKLYEMRRILPVDNLRLEGELSALPLKSIETEGQSGSEFAVCVNLTPLPFGCWQSDVISVGLPVPEPHVASGNLRCTTDAIELTDASGAVIGRTITWNDHWGPLYPREGRTRCGVAAFLNLAALDVSQKRTKRELAWSIAITTWRREESQEAYSAHRRSVFFKDV